MINGDSNFQLYVKGTQLVLGDLACLLMCVNLCYFCVLVKEPLFLCNYYSVPPLPSMDCNVDMVISTYLCSQQKEGRISKELYVKGKFICN